MSGDVTATALAPRNAHTQLVATGAELVELSERFYRGLFVGMLAFLGVACLAALLFLPLRESVHTGTPITVYATAVLVLATPVAVWRAADVYHALRDNRALELAVVVVAAALVAYPLRSELWWPSCALIMMISVLAPLRRTLAYCLVVLLANLSAHLIAGDLTQTPTVAIIGLWVGYPFWSATFSVIGDRFAAYVLRMQTTGSPPRDPPQRVQAWVTEDAAPSDPAATADEDHAAEVLAPPATVIATSHELLLGRLTARQLQVVALLVDGLLYREVAACLAITERQVQRHVANAVARTGVRTTNELIALAVAEGLAPARETPSHHFRPCQNDRFRT